VLDDVSVLTSSGITDGTRPSMVVEAVPLTSPAARHADAAGHRRRRRDLRGCEGRQRGEVARCVISRRGDGANYDSQGAVAFANVFGTCTTTLGNWTRGRLIDKRTG
jgi:hypothetical protein